MGHNGPPTGLYRENLVTGGQLARCPRRDLLEADPSVNAEIESMRLEVYPLWSKGMLLMPGTVGEQPARDLAFMREFDAVKGLTQLKADEIRASNPDSGLPDSDDGAFQ